MIEPVVQCAICAALPFSRAYAWNDAVLHCAETSHNWWLLRLPNGTVATIGPWVPKPEG
jgi:hypothetical protein